MLRQETLDHVRHLPDLLHDASPVLGLRHATLSTQKPQNPQHAQIQHPAQITQSQGHCAHRVIMILAVPTPGPLLTTSQLAKALGISASTVLNWQRDGTITPAFTTAGGHHRWIEADVREQIRRARQHDADQE